LLTKILAIYPVYKNSIGFFEQRSQIVLTIYTAFVTLDSGV